MYTPPTWTNGSGRALSAVNLQQIENGLSVVSAGGFYLDSYSGTDDQKLTAAIADQVASGGSSNYAPMLMAARSYSFNTVRTLYTGCNLQGLYSAARVPEIAGGNHEGTEINLGASITSGTSSWWVGSGSIYGVRMENFSVQGNQGSSVHQFMDVVNSGGTLYMCTFTSLGFNFMRSVFGRKDRPMGFTGVRLEGSWTINNLWDSQLTVGGSDNMLWVGGMVNLGISQSASQTGTWGDNDYMIHLQNMSKTDIGYVFCTAMNGWRGVRVDGANGSVSFFGGTWEGFKPTRVNGLLAGPAPGAVIRIDTGSANFYGVSIGQFMDNPDATENGGVSVFGGEVAFYGCHFYGDNTDTVNSIHHTGGRLVISGSNWMDRTGLVHAGRPKLASTAPIATQANLTASYTLWHDNSMELVGARSTIISIPTYIKTSAFVADDFASGLAMPALGIDTSTGKLYTLTATNGSTTATWTVVGTQT